VKNFERLKAARQLVVEHSDQIRNIANVEEAFKQKINNFEYHEELLASEFCDYLKEKKVAN
jgi:hypothetical protein